MGLEHEFTDSNSWGGSWQSEETTRLYVELEIPLGKKTSDVRISRCQRMYDQQIRRQELEMRREMLELEILRKRLEQMERPTSTDDW